jgi:hypothetical protein
VPERLRVVVVEQAALGEAELLAHEVDAGDLFGDGVLDLEARVHLEERDRAVGADEELARSRADVADLLEDGLGCRVEDLVLLVGEEGRGRLLDELLMAALQRAVARRDDDDVPAASARHCVSTWRGLSRYFSTKHSPRPKAAIASRVADSNSSATSSSSRATLRPRPPPP